MNDRTYWDSDWHLGFPGYELTTRLLILSALLVKESFLTQFYTVYYLLLH